VSECYGTPSTQYTQSDCKAVGGVYVHSYCYIDKCNYSLVSNHCYRYKTISYSNGTCQNIRGYYAGETVHPYHYYCYYTSFSCRYPAANGQCYSRSSNHSQAVCKTIPDSYFDVSNNTCYYYCTEMPKLRQCFVADNPSFTRETCAIIGGIYSNDTCYYITSYCPLHSASNSQCYTNRSADLNCNTCQNIGGHYENGYCYYYQDECNGYVIEGQCYSSRSSTYSANSCINMGGFYHNGYCYYEASKCRNAHYRNCTCFSYHTTYKTAATCVNIGGYIDFRIQQCFYNSSMCPYYSKNSQCYRYRNSDLSHKTCTSIKGYYARERDELQRYVYACYFDKSYYNCSDISSLGQCIVADNPTLTSETCGIIGGTYSNHTCYYTMLQCLLYNTSNGECYSNRSADLTCNTCENIGGHYENAYCYYYQDECNGYVIKGQCYSNRSSTYSANSCINMEGFFHDGYCYYEASKCRNAYYRNCTCFPYHVTSKTAATCANIGGYFDFRIQKCFYNSTMCPYYNKNSQCYRYRSSNLSHKTCTSIKGYYVRERDELQRYVYACYFDKSYYNCSDIPNLGECIVADNPTLTNETCRIIGGTYSNHTCYYTMLQCLLYNTSNGECYSNRSIDLTCNTCENIGGHYENGYCYYYQNNCSTYSIFGQCYSNRSSGYSTSSCNKMAGFYRNGYCYFENSRCSSAYYNNCTCFRYSDASKTASTCKNFGGYYDFSLHRCFYNLSTCPYYNKNSQCYKYRNAGFSSTTCPLISGYRVYESDSFGRYRYVCYYNEINCSNWANDQCYSYFSPTYNEGTCASAGGYYSQTDQGCYYNSFTCSYRRGSQCYDTYSRGWTKMQCDEANGYYDSYYGRCYTSNYYCPFVHYSSKRCYFYTSQSFDCSSCQLLDGFFYSGTCYYKTENCTEPLFLGSNGQCYENQTTVTTAADCRAMPFEAFYNGSDSLCYFSSGTCLSGQFYANCMCYSHRSPVYTAESCKIFGGYHANDRCYYNSSHCPSNYHSINGQCYQLSRLLTLPTCLNIGGHYDDPSTSGTSGTCYYNSFNCSGFTIDGRHCYMNRSTTYSRVTCRNIGGIYGYRYSGRRYQSAGSYLSSSRTYYCLYNTFGCSG